MTSHLASQSGQALSEYVLLVAFLSVVLFTPSPVLKHPQTNQNLSVVGALVASFQSHLNSHHKVIALPFP